MKRFLPAIFCKPYPFLTSRKSQKARFYGTFQHISVYFNFGIDYLAIIYYNKITVKGTTPQQKPLLLYRILKIEYRRFRAVLLLPIKDR